MSIPDEISLNVFYSGLDMETALELDDASGGWLAHTTPEEGRYILDSFLEDSFFSTDHSEPRREESASSHESLSTPESEPSSSTSQYSFVEPSPEPRTPKEEEIQPSEFSSQFEDDPSGYIKNTSNLRHEKPTESLCPYETLDKIFRHTPAMDWSKEAKRASEAIRISPTSATIPCSMKGNAIEALHDPSAEVSIIPECLLDTFVGNKPLTPTDKYFKSPSGLFFECRGIARDVPITVDKTEVHLDFYIYDILDFDLLLVYPLEKLLASHGSLDEMLRENASAIAAPCLENPMAKHCPEQNLLEEMVHTSPFVSSDPVLLEDVESFEEYDSEDSLHFCEEGRSSSPLIEFEPLPASLEYVVLDLNLESTSSFHDESLETENQWAMEFCQAPTLESEEKDSSNEHGSFTFDIPRKPCSFNATPESGMFSAPCTHEDYNHLIVFFCKIFRRFVVDVYVYRKYCKFCGYTVAQTL